MYRLQCHVQTHDMHAHTTTLESSASIQQVPEAQRAEFISMLSSFLDSVFADKEFCNINDVLERDVQHEINLEPGQAPPCKGVYRLSPPMLDELRTQLDGLLSSGLIRPSMSPYGAPVLFVKKKGGEWRMCVDYRALNKITVKDKFPIPRVEDLYDQVGGKSKFFTKIDLRWGYHKIKIRPEDVAKTAFRTQLGSFEWRCMTFGFANAPATFQRFVPKILHPALGKFACVYSETAEDHVKHVKKVLQIIKDNKLLAKLSKCEFFTKKVEYLGHVLSADGIRVDPSKIKVIVEWPVLRTKTEVRSFLGLANYYCKFIHNFSHIAAPLSALTHDNDLEPVPWGSGF